MTADVCVDPILQAKAKVLHECMYDVELKFHGALAQPQRTSVVAPAERYAKAKRKAASKRTDDGMPVHSFRTLLKDLATITKNRIQPNIPDSPAFAKIALPTRTQTKARDLLNVKL